MIRVAVSGAGGRLAGSIIAGIVDSDDLQLSGLYNPTRAGTAIEGVTITDVADELAGEVVVETAPTDVVFENLEAWRRSGMAAVVGTSGFTAGRLERLRALWGSETPCLVVPNFSMGAVLMMRFAAEAAPYFSAVEVIERHHADKPDSPSGTALATAMGLGSAGGSSATQSKELIPGARGADVAGVRVHSLRLPGLISQHEVALSNDGEVLSIEHLSTSYRSFANGALFAIRRVQELDPGVHLGLGSVL